MKRYLCVFCVLLTLSGTAFSQSAYDVIAPFIGIPGPGSRSEGLGQAYTAVSNDFAAAHYNPAGLAHITRSEIHVGGTYFLVNNTTETNEGQSVSESIDRSYFHNNAVGYLYPIANTKFTLGMGYYAASFFDRALRFRTAAGYQEEETEEVMLGSYTLTGGYQLNADLSVGATLHFYRGQNNFAFNASDFNYQIESAYSGLGLTFGFLYSGIRFMRTGMSVKTPITLDVDETYTEVESDQYDYRVKSPLSVSLGQAFNIGPFLVAGSITWRDWTLSRFLQDPNSPTLVDRDTQIPLHITENDYIQENYTSGLQGLEYGVGGEMLLPGVNAKVRGGMRYVPSYRKDSALSDALVLSLGGSIVLAQQFKIDVSYSQTTWDETYSNGWGADIHNSWLTMNFAYRF